MQFIIDSPDFDDVQKRLSALEALVTTVNNTVQGIVNELHPTAVSATLALTALPGA